MNEKPFAVPDDDDLWIIPLHGASVPLPPTAEIPESTTPPEHSTTDSIAEYWDERPHDVPTDVGFQPRLRRSA